MNQQKVRYEQTLNYNFFPTVLACTCMVWATLTTGNEDNSNLLVYWDIWNSTCDM